MEDVTLCTVGLEGGGRGRKEGGGAQRNSCLATIVLDAAEESVFFGWVLAAPLRDLDSLLVIITRDNSIDDSASGHICSERLNELRAAYWQAEPSEATTTWMGSRRVQRALISKKGLKGSSDTPET